MLWRKRTILAVLPALLLIFVITRADDHAIQIDPDRGTAGLARKLRELSTRASFIHFTAHPDDEDGGMLAYETRGAGARGALFACCPTRFA